MQNNNPNNYIQEGEIHLREFINLLINSKKLIIVVTLFFSLIATIYAYSLKPKYEASAVIEVGYHLDQNYEKITIENPNKTVKSLIAKYINIPNQADGNSILQSAKYIGDQFISVKSISTSPDTAIKNIETFVLFIINDHQTKLNNRRNRTEKWRNEEIIKRKTKIDQLYIDLEKLRIENDIKTHKYEQEFITLTKEKQTLAFLWDDYNTHLKELNEKIKFLKSTDYDLSSYVLLLSEKRLLYGLISKNNIDIDRNELLLIVLEYDKKHHDLLFYKDKERLEKELQNKLDEVNMIKSLSQKNDDSMTNIYNEITTNEVPVRKLLITIVGFVAGFFLSIFGVLTRQAFLQEQK